MYRPKLLFALLIAVLCVTADARAEKFYKWTDANGVVQYSSTPPPKGEETMAVTVSRAPAAPPPAPDATTAVKTDAAPGTEKTAEAKAEEEQIEREYRRDMCALSQRQLSESERYGNKRVVEVRGEQRSVALPAQRAAETAKWKEEIAKYCN